MRPFEIRRQTVSELRKVILAMMSSEWDLALEGRSEAEVVEAARSLLRAQRARLRLGSDVSIRFDYVTSIPRTRNGKHRFVLSSIAKPRVMGLATPSTDPGEEGGSE